MLKDQDTSPVNSQTKDFLKTEGFLYWVVLFNLLSKLHLRDSMENIAHILINEND